MNRLATLTMLAGMVLLTLQTANAETQQEKNKKTVREFYETAINQKDFAAASKYMGPRYIQHNPRAAVIPVQTGIQYYHEVVRSLDTRFRGSQLPRPYSLFPQAKRRTSSPLP